MTLLLSQSTALIVSRAAEISMTGHVEPVTV